MNPINFEISNNNICNPIGYINSSNYTNSSGYINSSGYKETDSIWIQSKQNPFEKKIELTAIDALFDSLSVESLTLTQDQFKRIDWDEKHDHLYFTIFRSIQQIKLSLILENQNGRKTIINDTLGLDNNFIIKPSGKVYVCMNTLGKGKYKITKKGLLIGIIQEKESNNSCSNSIKESKFRAISLPILSNQNNQETQQELNLNLHLKNLKEQNENLSQVNVIKSICSANLNDIVVVADLYDGNIDNFIKLNTLTSEQKHSICAEMSKAIGQLHEVNLVHRDCKLDNFLFKLDEHNQINQIVISDFGLSSFANQEDDKPGYNIFIPIVESNWPTKTNSFSSDIYQLGIACLLSQLGLGVSDWELIFNEGVARLSQTSDLNSNGKIRKWKEDPLNWVDTQGNSLFNQIQDEEVRNFILLMISANREERPTHQEVTAFFEKKTQEF